MGGRLVTNAVNLMSLGRVKGLSTRSRLMLLAVCSVARDAEQKNVQAGIYFGGWEYLSTVLGFPEYSGTAERAVARCIGELTAAGLIEPQVDRPGNGRRQVYLVTLPGVFG